jgi:hypothetical protein
VVHSSRGGHSLKNFDRFQRLLPTLLNAFKI